MGQIGDVAAYPYVAESAASDDHPVARHEAVQAIGDLPEADADDLLSRIQREDPEVRDSAGLALATLASLRERTGAATRLYKSSRGSSPGGNGGSKYAVCARSMSGTSNTLCSPPTSRVTLDGTEL